MNKNGFQIKMDYSTDTTGLVSGLVTVINTTPVDFLNLELSFAVVKVT
jgi:hypothetical protein